MDCRHAAHDSIFCLAGALLDDDDDGNPTGQMTNAQALLVDQLLVLANTLDSDDFSLLAAGAPVGFDLAKAIRKALSKEQKAKLKALPKAKPSS